MARKTWVKVKRGILMPKHRVPLGIRVWLFLYMIDICDWPTGTIPEWLDKSAADELGMPVDTVRKQRRQLEVDGYISCEQGQHSQQITIHKWVDPRKYDGEIINEGDHQEQGEESEEPLDVGVGESGHPGVVKSDHPDENEIQGDHQGDHQVIQQMATPSLSSHDTFHIDDWIQVITNIGNTFYPKRMYRRNSDFHVYWMPTEFAGRVDGKYIVLCKSKAQRDWLEDRGKKIAETKIQEYTGEPAEVIFTVGKPLGMG